MSVTTKKIGALTVAKYFIDRANKEKKPITNKKLQKLLYYAQVWSLVLNKEKLFSERIEAWVHGPAIPIVYKKFRSFEFNPIQLDTTGYSFDFSKKQKKEHHNYDVPFFVGGHSLTMFEYIRQLSQRQLSSQFALLQNAYKLMAVQGV